MNLKRIYSLFCALSALCSVYAQHLDGSWHGALYVGGQKLELIFKFKEVNGERICTMDVPQQSLKDFRMHITQLNDTLVELQSPPFKEYPGLNHLFQHCQSSSPAEYHQIEETLAPEVMQDIAEWINRLH